MKSKAPLGGYICTADWHCHTWREGGEPIQGQHGRLRDFINAIRFLRVYAQEHQVKTIWMLGDVFHLKKNVPVEAFNTLWEYIFNHFDDISINFLAGNHDRDTDRREDVTILPFKATGTVFTEPTVLGDLTVVVPWLYDQEAVRNFLKNLPKKAYRTLFFHGELDGVEVGPTDYMLPSKMTPETLNLSRFERAFAGHIHKRQHVKGVWYPGSLIPKDFGELERDKGFLHILPNERVHIVKVPSPLFKVFPCPENVPSFTESLIKSLCDEVKGHFVRFIGDLPAGVRERLEAAGPRYLDVRPAGAIQTKPTEPPTTDAENLDGLVESYVEQKGVPPEIADEYVDYGIRQLRKEE